jgi:hypothetical protein
MHLANLFDVKVGQADGLHQALVDQFLHRMPGLNEVTLGVKAEADGVRADNTARTILCRQRETWSLGRRALGQGHSRTQRSSFPSRGRLAANG